jgi:hypothetical protein
MKVFTCGSEGGAGCGRGDLGEDVVADAGVVGSHHLKALDAIALEVDQLELRMASSAAGDPGDGGRGGGERR